MQWPIIELSHEHSCSYHLVFPFLLAVMSCESPSQATQHLQMQRLYSIHVLIRSLVSLLISYYLIAFALPYNYRYIALAILWPSASAALLFLRSRYVPLRSTNLPTQIGSLCTEQVKVHNGMTNLF